MKRRITLLLTLLMVLSVPFFASCAKNTPPEPELTTETEIHTAPATQTVPIPSETVTSAAAETDAESTAEETISANVPSLIGSWTFAVDSDVDFYYTFLKDGGLQVSNDMTGILEFKDGEVTIAQGENMGTYAYTAEGDSLRVEQDGICILDLTAQDSADASALQGLYRINNCALYPDAESKDMQLRFDPNKLWIVAGGTYSVENNTLYMTSGDNTFSQEFAFEGDKLIFTEEDGSETVLVRLEQG